jgi:preprotein translocase subunit SecG
MSFVIGLLTFVMVAVSLFLILLVLVQLPKKDAGAGMAFGGGTADALFGAGSGNMLTKITGWAAAILLGLALLLGRLQSVSHTESAGSEFANQVQQKQQQVPISVPAQQPKPPTTTPAANNLLTTPLAIPATNAAPPAPATTATNQPK